MTVEVTPAITRAGSRTPGGSEVTLSPEGRAKVQAVLDMVMQTELEAATAAEAAAEAATAAAELASAIDDEPINKTTSFEADADLDPDLISALSEVFKGAGEAETAAARLTARLISVRQIADAEDPPDVMGLVATCGFSISRSAAKRLYSAARSFFPADLGSETSVNDSDTMRPLMARALDPRPPAARKKGAKAASTSPWP